MRKAFVFLFIFSFLLLACHKSKGIPYEATPTSAVISSTEQTTAPAPEPQNLSCQASSQCAGKLCIDNTCQTIADLYKTDCPTKCSFSSLTFSTSDGEHYALGEGQGTYTAAGALEWKVATVPDFCLQESLVVPLLLIKKNYGKIVAEEVITLKEGQTSKIITHPSIKSVKFTVKADKIGTSCK